MQILRLIVKTIVFCHVGVAAKQKVLDNMFPDKLSEPRDETCVILKLHKMVCKPYLHFCYTLSIFVDQTKFILSTTRLKHLKINV